MFSIWASEAVLETCDTAEEVSEINVLFPPTVGPAEELDDGKLAKASPRIILKKSVKTMGSAFFYYFKKFIIYLTQRTKCIPIFGYSSSEWRIWGKGQR